MTLDEMIKEFEKAPPIVLFMDTPARRDLRAFNLLNELVPSTRPIIGCAEHDEIWIDVDPEELAKVITVEQITELRTYGVRYDKSTGSLTMFV